MAVSDYHAASDPAVDRRWRAEGPDERELADLAEVDRLIGDLAALVEAGLVIVESHAIGPARYTVPCPQLDDAA
jgi:hypothetical protein